MVVLELNPILHPALLSGFRPQVHIPCDIMPPPALTDGIFETTERFYFVSSVVPSVLPLELTERLPVRLLSTEHQLSCSGQRFVIGYYCAVSLGGVPQEKLKLRRVAWRTADALQIFAGLAFQGVQPLCVLFMVGGWRQLPALPHD
jgi:hypothetical protein